MRELLRRQQWIELSFLTGLIVAACAVMYVLVTHQRHADVDDINASLIRSNQQMIEQVRAEVGRLEQSQRNIQQTTEPLKGLSRAIEAVKEATKPEARP